ncbi:MAG: hypothetical protein L0212_05735 [Acidobacteria bacterium]|nr:hypothetical protein [Acidobacteriota bacterium]
MKRLFAFAIALGLALAMPELVAAKPGTAKIVITGGRLTRPLEVTDPTVLRNFSVWHGYLGQRVTAAPAGESHPYEVRFHVRFSDTDTRMAYVAYYHPRPAGERGYIYLPRSGEQWHQFNASTIQQATGWFHASPEWDALIKPRIEAAESTQRR